VRLVGEARDTAVSARSCAAEERRSRSASLAHADAAPGGGGPRPASGPLARPGIVSAGIFAFTLSWNEFIYALTLVTASSERTIPVGVLVQLTRADFYFWGPLMAGALAGSIPVALIYSFFVDQYAAGLTAGAVKG
jgi:hypothetical protein